MASQGSKTYGKNAHMSLGRVLAMIYTNLVGEEEAVTVGPGRNDRRPGDKGLSTKSLCLSTGRVV